MINALEEVVRNTFRELRARDASYCRCQQCEDDVTRFAMNNAKPRYISDGPLGAAVTRVALSQDAAKAEIAVVVIDAMRRVSRRPLHDPSVRAGRGAPRTAEEKPD